MGLVESKLSQLKKRSAENTHKLFFDVYKNTVNILKPKTEQQVDNDQSFCHNTYESVMKPEIRKESTSVDTNHNFRIDGYVSDHSEQDFKKFEVGNYYDGNRNVCNSACTCAANVQGDNGIVRSQLNRETVVSFYNSFPSDGGITGHCPDNGDDDDDERNRSESDRSIPYWCSCSNPYCNYTCHMRCSAHVTLNCNSPSIAPERPEDYNAATSDAATLPMDAVHFGESGERLLVSAPIRCQELQRKLSAYNASASPGKEMILSEDGQSVSGFIRVHMNLCRPINVVSESKPLSLHNIIHPTADGIAEKTLTSFYLPRDTIKALHVHSSSTTQEVISALLKKFKVADNPRKYALYERYYDNRDSMKVKMRRLQDIEHPLLLALMCGEMQESTAQHQQQFVLQENETGDISWDAFSLPELNNFLKILQREEEEYQNQVRLKYKYIQTKLQEVIDQWISVNQQQQDVTGDFECSDANGVASGVIDKDEEQSESSSENTNEECKDAFPQQSFTTAPGLYPGFRTSSQLLDVS